MLCEIFKLHFIGNSCNIVERASKSKYDGVKLGKDGDFVCINVVSRNSSPDNLKKFFIDCVNIIFCLCKP
jgi:hypothetical protein